MAASSASAKPAPWEVWLAYLRFADHPEAGKVRPVVIIDGKAAAIVVAKVTTADPQERYTYCELADWEREGLLKLILNFMQEALAQYGEGSNKYLVAQEHYKFIQENWDIL